MFKSLLIVLMLVLSSCSSQKAKEEADLFKGYFSYLADAALFTDCKDNMRYPVAMESDYLKLEKEYLGVVDDGGEKLLITFTGEIVERNRVEGEGKRKFVVVKKLVSISPNKKCEDQ